MPRYIDADKMITDTEAMKTVSEAIIIDGIIQYINDNATDQKNISSAYNAGLKDAWEAAKKICCLESSGGLAAIEIHHIFDCRYPDEVLTRYKPSEAVKMIRSYEEGKETNANKT